jgi:ubiquinone/menaquinone biosynthesis C-methylase UbiE/uncharacterized protein YbaR (Trm112 family)
VCHGEEFKLSVNHETDLEIREGEVVCQRCDRSYFVKEGILDMLVDPTDVIIMEQNGWTRLEKAVPNTDEIMHSLPRPTHPEHQDSWAVTANNYEYVWNQLELSGDERILDLGSGRCWVTRDFAREGCYAVGIDILLPKYAGLKTADIYLQNEPIFFERIMGDMNDLPFRDGMFEMVFSCASLHHSSELSKVIKEIARILKPGGKCVLVCESEIGLFSNKIVDTHETDAGINENAYTLYDFGRQFRKQNMKYKLVPYVGDYNPIVRKLNSIYHRLFPSKMAQRVWPPLLYVQIVVFGGVLNLIASKE